jgi:ATP-dependent DNA helicase RecG
MSKKQLSEKLKIILKANSLRLAISKLIDSCLIEYTIPGKPNSRLQKYHLTDKGREKIMSQNEEI